MNFSYEKIRNMLNVNHYIWHVLTVIMLHVDIYVSIYIYTYVHKMNKYIKIKDER